LCRSSPRSSRPPSSCTARELLVCQRTQTVNTLRGLLAEFGVAEAKGIWHVGRLKAHLEEDSVVPEPGRGILALLIEQLETLERQLDEVDAAIKAWHRRNPVSRRLTKIPGLVPVIASAIAATMADASVFHSGREFAAWLGLVPRQRSTGGKPRLGWISRQSDKYVRRRLIIGAQSALQRSKEIRDSAWVQGLLGRCARLKVAVALANKTARIAWAMMVMGKEYRRPAAA
jgi:transposase